MTGSPCQLAPPILYSSVITECLGAWQAAHRIIPLVFCGLLISPATPAAIIFSNATVINVERGELQTAMSVVVTSNRITAVVINGRVYDRAGLDAIGSPLRLDGPTETARLLTRIICGATPF